MAEKTNEKNLPMVISQGTATETAVMPRLSDKYAISAPLFLAFAEYLGYITPLMPWVDQWCSASKRPTPMMVRAITMDATNAFNEVTKAFSAKELRSMYDDLYELVLNVYDANLKELDNKTV